MSRIADDGDCPDLGCSQLIPDVRDDGPITAAPCTLPVPFSWASRW